VEKKTGVAIRFGKISEVLFHEKKSQKINPAFQIINEYLKKLLAT
jgi:hypothetical protein